LVDSHPEFDEEERLKGIYIQNKLKKLYEVSNDQEKKANFITRFFLNFLRLANSANGDFFYDGVSDYMLFNYYTANQYRTVTHEEPQGKPSGTFGKGDLKVDVWSLPSKFKNKE
jgi:hypothetical protein